MPELPEVETVRRGLEPVFVGRRLVAVRARRPDLRFPFPDGFEARLSGRIVESLDRRAKFLLFRFDEGTVLVAHLGMSGRFRVFESAAPPPEAHDHVEFEVDSGTVVRFNDARRFGFMDLTTEAALTAYPMLVRLGPEPLSNSFDGPMLAERLAGRRTPIKAALLDQSVVAGLGNIYVCESLYRAGISPFRSAATVAGRRADRLADAIRAILTEAIESGGSSLRDHRRPDGELGYFQHRFAVYGRAGESCPGCDCEGAGIRRVVQSGRATFHCPRRQH